MAILNLNIILTEEQTKLYSDWIKPIVKGHFDEEVEFPGVTYTIETSPCFGTTLIISVGSVSIEFEIEMENYKTILSQ